MCSPFIPNICLLDYESNDYHDKTDAKVNPPPDGGESFCVILMRDVRRAHLSKNLRCTGHTSFLLPNLGTEPPEPPTLIEIMKIYSQFYLDHQPIEINLMATSSSKSCLAYRKHETSGMAKTILFLIWILGRVILFQSGSNIPGYMDHLLFMISGSTS